MVCESCGEKPKKCGNCNKDFPRAVIEINNPEEIILFRKVVIPTSMGDESAVPAAIGKYRNVLLNYEVNNHSYLYSSDGIPTLLTSEVAESIEQRVKNLEIEMADEVEIRRRADSELQTQIDTKANISDLATVATTGSYNDLLNKPTIGNATLTIKRNSSDVGTFSANATSNSTVDISVPTTPSDIGAQPAITSSNKLSADLVNDSSTTNKFVTSSDLTKISTAIQPADINKTVMTDMDVSSSSSTTTVVLKESKENLMSGSQSTKNLVLPVASTTEAGVMNSSTFDAVTNNTNNLSALMNGAVAVTGLSASPSQSDITTAWQTETGLTTLINRASVYDVTNDKVWTYYTNDSTWHVASNTTQVTINTFTNSSEGTIKGSTNTGQIFAENDGTGSVNGWDALNTTVSGKQDALTAGSNISISSNTISATNDKVAQKKDTSSNNSFPVLFKYASSTTDATAYVKYGTAFTCNPSTGKVQATSGSIAIGDNNLVTGDVVNTAVSAKVNIANIDLSNQTTTILAQVQSLAANGISYARFSTVDNGSAANISDNPKSGYGFICIAYRYRYTSATDYAYEVVAYSSGDEKPYYTRIKNNTSTVTWSQLSAVAFSGSYSDLSNKPTIPAAQVNSDWNANSGVEQILNKPSLATVATSGSYNDLTNKPTIPAAQVNSDWNANSGVAQILNKPVIPTKTFYGTCSTAAGTAAKTVTCAEFTSTDLVAGTRIAVKFTNGNSYNGTATLNINGTGAKDIYYNGSTTNTRYMWTDGESVDFVYNGSQWATINGGLATTTYYGVTKLQTSPTSTSTGLALTPASLNSYSQYTVTGAPVYSASSTYAVGDLVRNGNYTYRCNTAITTAEAWNSAHWTVLDPIQTQIDNLATVATTGSYSDLTNTPTIPTVNNATLTIQKNGTTVNTFTANASSNVTANIEVPVITMQTTDPGEGATLAANNFIAVYSA